jgi:hypothetical protein
MKEGDRVTAVADLGGWPPGASRRFTLRVPNGRDGTYIGPYVGSEYDPGHSEGPDENMSEWHLAAFQTTDPDTEGVVDVVVPGHVPAHFIVHSD